MNSCRALTRICWENRIKEPDAQPLYKIPKGKKIGRSWQHRIAAMRRYAKFAAACCANFFAKSDIQNLVHGNLKFYVMLMMDGSEYKKGNYSSYKNRVFSKHLDKMKNALRQIKDCSLKPADKVKLKTELIKILNEVDV
jgi:hypothetical protein